MRALPAAVETAVKTITGRSPVEAHALTGGCVAEVRRVDLDDGSSVVAKIAADGGLEIEGAMLRYLRAQSTLPVPEVLGCTDDFLLMAFVETRGTLGDAAQAHAADLLAALHAVTAPRFGFAQDTVIGPLALPNPWTDNWCDFFRDHRLMHFGRLAQARGGGLSVDAFVRLEAFCADLDRYIPPEPAASLLHGDMWDGNVLVHDRRIAAFIDPAIFYGDAELELGFATVFHTFREAFFARYHEHRPIDPEFFATRREIYTLYPLLVHAALFGAAYGQAVDRILRRFVP